jgi:hypothetical protein
MKACVDSFLCRCPIMRGLLRFAFLQCQIFRRWDTDFLGFRLAAEGLKYLSFFMLRDIATLLKLYVNLYGAVVFSAVEICRSRIVIYHMID